MPDDGGTGAPSETVRLQKFLARAGVASRRKCEALILDGRIQVNGRVVAELGTKVDPLVDEVAFDGVPVASPAQRRPVVIALNKPAGYLTAMSDPRSSQVVSALVPMSKHKGLFPVGRLDRDTTGLLLFTTDGELGNALLHPSRGVVKRYVALVEGTLSPDDVAALEAGVELDDGMTSPARCEILEAIGNPVARMRVALEIHEGRKRQVRRMFASLGHDVLELERVTFGPIALGELAIGEWRELGADELSHLYAACGLE